MSDIREIVAGLRRRIQDLERTIGILEAEFGKTAPMTQWDFIKHTLEEEQKPLGVQELSDRMLAHGWKTTSKNPTGLLYVQVRELARKGDLVKMGRGRWGLPQWEASAKKKLQKALDSVPS